MRILLTGSEGFIGSHLVETLVSRGHEVVCFVQYTSIGSIGWLKDLEHRVASQLTIALGDVRDQATVLRAATNVEAVVHLAALISVPYSFDAPASFVETNVLGTLNVVEAAASVGARRTLIMSTSEVYGSARKIPMSEEHPLCAQSPYAASKIGAEKMAESLALSRDLDVVIARAFNTYGPRQSTRAVVASIIQQVLAGRNDVRLGIVDTRRDMNYVTDVTEALAMLLEAEKPYRADVFNIATGSSVTISDLVAKVGQIAGRKLRIVTDASRFRPAGAEVDHLEGDASKLRFATGWTPRHDLHLGLSKTMASWAASKNEEHPGI